MKLKKTLLLILFSLVSYIGISQTVHYTNTGSKYHSAGCKYLKKSDYTCTLSEAFSKGLTACSRCHPPTKIVKEKKRKSKKEKQTKSAKSESFIYPKMDSQGILWCALVSNSQNFKR